MHFAQIGAMKWRHVVLALISVSAHGLSQLAAQHHGEYIHVAARSVAGLGQGVTRVRRRERSQASEKAVPEPVLYSYFAACTATVARMFSDLEAPPGSRKSKNKLADFGIRWLNSKANKHGALCEEDIHE